MRISWKEQLESERQSTQPRVPVQETKISKPLTEKPVGIAVVGETPRLTEEFVGETHRVLEFTQIHLPGGQHRKGPMYLWVAGEVTERRGRAEQVALFFLGPLPHIQHHNAAKWVSLPLWIPKALPLQHNRYAETKKKVQIKEQIRTPEKELSDEEISNLSDAELKTLVIRMLTEMIEYGHKIKEEVKAMQSEIKKNVQGTNSEGKETGTQIKDLDKKEEINMQPEQNEETRIQKNKKRLRNLQDNFKSSNI